MKCFGRVAVIIMIMYIWSVGSAVAVGYERLYAENTRPTKVSVRQEANGDGWRALKKASFIDSIPGILDDTAMLVRDVLSQFGLVEKKAP